jgi:heat shock protein HslJ
MGRRPVLAVTALGFAVLVLAGCHGIGGPAADPLDGTSWVIVSLEDKAPLPGIEVTAVFERGKLHGFSGCNQFGGSYTVNGDRIRISELQSTLMACIAPEGAMDQEQEFLRLLSASDSYQLTDGQLRLLHSGQVVLAFIPHD